jgi:heme A synthase
VIDTRTTPRAHVPASSGRLGFRGLLAIYIAALIVEFWLGMAVNLFVTIPTQHPGADAPNFSGIFESTWWAILSGPSIWLTLHAALGILLVFGAVRLFIWSLRKRRRVETIALGIAASGVVLAGIGGGRFLAYDQDISSMLMATGFAVSIMSYVFALSITDDPPLWR